MNGDASLVALSIGDEGAIVAGAKQFLLWVYVLCGGRLLEAGVAWLAPDALRGRAISGDEADIWPAAAIAALGAAAFWLLARQVDWPALAGQALWPGLLLGAIALLAAQAIERGAPLGAEWRALWGSAGAWRDLGVDLGGAASAATSLAAALFAAAASCADRWELASGAHALAAFAMLMAARGSGFGARWAAAAVVGAFAALFAHLETRGYARPPAAQLALGVIGVVVLFEMRAARRTR